MSKTIYLRSMLKDFRPESRHKYQDLRKMYDLFWTSLIPVSLGGLAYAAYQHYSELKNGPAPGEKTNATDFKLKVYGPGNVMRNK